MRPKNIVFWISDSIALIQSIFHIIPVDLQVIVSHKTQKSITENMELN